MTMKIVTAAPIWCERPNAVMAKPEATARYERPAKSWLIPSPRRGRPSGGMPSVAGPRRSSRDDPSAI